jgi:hypothetical protein
MSVPLADAALPAPRHGDITLKCEALASCGSAEMFPNPLAGSGVVQQ